MNKLKIFLFAFFSILALSVPMISYASLNLGSGLVQKAAEKAGYDKNTTPLTLSENAGQIIKWALSMVGVIFLLLMVYAGYLWMTAQGDEDNIEKASKIIKAAVVGLIITTGAYSITSLVVPRIVQRTSGSYQTTLCCKVCPNQSSNGSRVCELIPVSSEDSCQQLCTNGQCTFSYSKRANCSGRETNP